MQKRNLVAVLFTFALPFTAHAAELTESFDDDIFDDETFTVSTGTGFSFAVQDGKAVTSKAEGTGNGSSFLTTLFLALGDFTISAVADRAALGNAEIGLMTHHGSGYSDVFFVASHAVNSNIQVGAVSSGRSNGETGNPVTFRISRSGETLVHEYDNGSGFVESQNQTHADLAGPVKISLFLIQEFGDTGANTGTFDQLHIVADAFTLCGNSSVETAEGCDDGDFAWAPGQACNATCELLACGDPDDTTNVTASDALFVLRTSVSAVSCDACVCDTDSSGGATPVTAGDALRTLRNAVGLGPALSCPACG